LTHARPEGTNSLVSRPAALPEGLLAAWIEILYLRYPVHPNITVIQVGPGIERIEKEGGSYFIIGTDDGPLAGKKVEIPSDNVSAVQWALDEAPAPPGQ
jgi:hypothetical protein